MFFDPQKYLGSWASNYKDTLFVCGSYHRSRFSTMLRKSFAEDIITQHSAAVLIAHTF
jgi:nucleotide-binding universal stress UspA family protein